MRYEKIGLEEVYTVRTEDEDVLAECADFNEAVKLFKELEYDGAQYVERELVDLRHGDCVYSEIVYGEKC